MKKIGYEMSKYNGLVEKTTKLRNELAYLDVLINNMSDKDPIKVDGPSGARFVTPSVPAFNRGFKMESRAGHDFGAVIYLSERACCGIIPYLEKDAEELRAELAECENTLKVIEELIK